LTFSEKFNLLIFTLKLNESKLKKGALWKLITGCMVQKRQFFENISTHLLKAVYPKRIELKGETWVE
jgi:hypothetical protein